MWLPVQRKNHFLCSYGCSLSGAYALRCSTQKFKQKREMMQCHKGLKYLQKQQRFTPAHKLLFKCEASRSNFSPVPKLTCSAVRVFFILNWWVREESPGKIIFLPPLLHLPPSGLSCFRSPGRCFHSPSVWVKVNIHNSIMKMATCCCVDPILGWSLAWKPTVGRRCSQPLGWQWF